MVLIMSHSFAFFCTCDQSQSSPAFSARLSAPQDLTQGSLTLRVLIGFTKGKFRQEFGTEIGQGIYLLVLCTSQSLGCGGNPAPLPSQFCRLGLNFSAPALTSLLFLSLPLWAYEWQQFSTSANPRELQHHLCPPTSSLESIKFSLKSQLSVLFRGPVR